MTGLSTDGTTQITPLPAVPSSSGPLKGAIAYGKWPGRPAARLRMVSGISNAEMIREPIMELFEAAIPDPADALTAFQSWCQPHTYEVEMMAFGTAFRLTAQSTPDAFPGGPVPSRTARGIALCRWGANGSRSEPTRAFPARAEQPRDPCQVP